MSWSDILIKSKQDLPHVVSDVVGFFEVYFTHNTTL